MYMYKFCITLLQTLLLPSWIGGRMRDAPCQHWCTRGCLNEPWSVQQLDNQGILWLVPCIRFSFSCSAQLGTVCDKNCFYLFYIHILANKTSVFLSLHFHLALSLLTHTHSYLLSQSLCLMAVLTHTHLSPLSQSKTLHLMAVLADHCFHLGPLLLWQCIK